MRGIMGEANVGRQHNASTYLAQPELHPWCQGKHYAGYGGFPRDSFTSSAQVGEASLMELYLRPWLAFIGNGGRGVMASHNMMQSEPLHASHHWLTDVLRNRLGLGGGYIGSDNGNVGDLYTKYGVASSNADAAGLWLESGGDQAMASLPTDDHKPANVSALIADGLLSRSALDRAAGNVLRVKFASGIFDAPFTDRSTLGLVDSLHARSLARVAAADGIVLLSNNPTAGRKAMLPLPAALGRVAVIGALGGCAAGVSGPIRGPPGLCLAKMAMAGGYSDGYGDTTFRYLEIDTLSDALKQRGATVTFAEGAAPDEPADGRKIAEALTVARSADVVVLTVGDSACAHIGSCTCGEAIHSPGR
jgi:beta-glucosidase-like glycosyl hydrolase